MNKQKNSTLEIAEKKLTLDIGNVASQATSSVMARLGDTMVLATVVEGSIREDLGYFPLTVEYVERLYAGGRIKGSRWVKREGRPSDDAILIARLIDRSIRPLFPKEYKNEVQIVVTVLSVDGENEPDILSIIAVSTALSISRIPWNGPVSATRVGLVSEKQNDHKEFLLNPGRAEIELSDLDMVITQTNEKTIMIEAGANQVSEEFVLQAIERAQVENKTVIKHIENLAKEIGEKKASVVSNGVFLSLVHRLEKSYKQEITNLIKSRATKEATGDESGVLIETIFEQDKMANPEEPIDKKLVGKALEYILFQSIREQVLSKNKRPDGRAIDEVRPISLSVSVLPRTHGSAIFQRGNTQALTVVTLAPPRLEQLIESAEGEEAKRYIHHYSMPPYSVGETGRMGVPSRREIGHGALAERALLTVIPPQEKFPYTIRVVSEILSSNGSTSMASVCGSTLALMDAGVPIIKPVAGIAMGMMSSQNGKKDEYVILTDIIGLEDFSGDMDFKVAGTNQGITAMQLDVKIPGLTLEQIKETFDKARIARLFILEKMLAVMPSTRSAVSEYALKIKQINIPVDKIGELIGPGGRVIRNIIAQTGATVDVEDDGAVTISSISEEAVGKATEWVHGLTRELKVGEVFTEGVVKRILPFGAFVEVLPGKEGMVHVSHMANRFVKEPSEVISIGDRVRVKVIEIDEQGRVNFSMIFSEEAQSHKQQDSGGEYSHPLSRQFRRERSFQPGGGSRNRRPDQASWRRRSGSFKNSPYKANR